MRPSFLDCRLIHKDYDKNLKGLAKRDKEVASKKQLLDNFINSFKIANAKIGNYVITSSNYEPWYFSVSHARGTTMIFIAKWFVGIDVLANCDVPDNYLEIANKHFSSSELAWFNTHNSKVGFAELWTAKESFYKCYFNQFNKAPDFNNFKLITIGNNLAYSNKKTTYECKKGIGGNYYSFAVCSQVI